MKDSLLLQIAFIWQADNFSPRCICGFIKPPSFLQPRFFDQGSGSPGRITTNVVLRHFPAHYLFASLFKTTDVIQTSFPSAMKKINFPYHFSTQGNIKQLMLFSACLIALTIHARRTSTGNKYCFPLQRMCGSNGYTYRGQFYRSISCIFQCYPE